MNRIIFIEKNKPDGRKNMKDIFATIWLFVKSLRYVRIILLANAQLNSFQVLFVASFYDCILNKEQYKSMG